MLELFEKQRFQRRSPPMVSFRAGGFIAVNREAMELFGGGEGKQEKVIVHLLRDKQEGLVVLRAKEKQDKNTFILRRRSELNTAAYIMCAKSFFLAHHLDLKATKRFKAEKYGEGMICFAMNGKGK